MSDVQEPSHDPDPSSGDDGALHVVERGDRWEVWRKGDSMPLGTYFTWGEAEDHARTAAAAAHAEVVDHDQTDLEPPVASDPDEFGTEFGPGSDPMTGEAPTG